MTRRAEYTEAVRSRVGVIVERIVVVAVATPDKNWLHAEDMRAGSFLHML